MDWQGKVSSLLRETENNLSKVKRKVGNGGIRGNNDWKCKKFSSSLPMKKYSSLSDITQRPVQFQSSFMSSGRQDTHYNIPENYNLASNPVFTHSLQQKLDQQNKLIDQLMQMVHKLESERSNYSEQIRDIRGEIQQIGNRLPDKNHSAESYVDHRIEQVKRDLLSEVHLNNQHHIYRTKSNSYQATDSQLNSLSRDVQDIKHNVREELEIVRRDVDVMKTRVMKMEMDVSSMLSNHKDLERRQDRFDRAVQELTTPRSFTKAPSVNTGYSWQTPTSTDKLLLEDLRSTGRRPEELMPCAYHLLILVIATLPERSSLSSLKQKVDTVETTMLNRDLSHIVPPQPYTSFNGYRPPTSNGYGVMTHSNYKPSTNELKPSNDSREMMLEDLNLSDDDTSLDTFSADPPPEHPKSSENHITDHVDSDDDNLDLDDLDLSDDDTVSLDLETHDSTHF